MPRLKSKISQLRKAYRTSFAPDIFSWSVKNAHDRAKKYSEYALLPNPPPLITVGMQVELCEPSALVIFWLSGASVVALRLCCDGVAKVQKSRLI
jgi:hypothetical protein